MLDLSIYLPKRRVYAAVNDNDSSCSPVKQLRHRKNCLCFSGVR